MKLVNAIFVVALLSGFILLVLVSDELLVTEIVVVAFDSVIKFVDVVLIDVFVVLMNTELIVDDKL